MEEPALRNRRAKVRRKGGAADEGKGGGLVIVSAIAMIVLGGLTLVVFWRRKSPGMTGSGPGE
ncbi:hypothetical protein [Streptosporangium roseum]|uniref:hypothetical protein n=1 Tax=Streptosporangium roseum TaxID=2001 RepID=UPI0004CD78D3|nr:hypothetical protein [Streptosporangium roseum]